MFSIGCTSKESYLITGTYTGSGSEGIYVYKFDNETGKISEVSHTESSVINPSFVIVSGKFVYAVNETNGANPGGVSSFSFNKENGQLTFLNKQLTGGDDPCHLAISKDGKSLVVANYSGGSVALFPVNEDGSLKPYSQLIQHTGKGINKERQEKPHVHETVFSADGNYLFTPDLGLDKMMIYQFDGKKDKPLTPANPAFFATMPGSGPRHISFAPDQKYAYLIQELTGMVTACQYDDGKFSEIQNIAAYPIGHKGKLDGAEIMVTNDGKFLYTSQRGDLNNIAVFSIDANNGKLKNEGFQSTGGKGPRSFVIDPTGDFLLVANQNSDNIIVFKRDKNTGILEPTGIEMKVPNPVCLQMIPL